MTETSKQVETTIIDTVKGRKGSKVVYSPLGLDGKPLVSSNEQAAQTYNEKGEIQIPETKGNIIETEV